VANRVHLKVNGSILQATTNQSLVSAALLAGMVIPHDCSSGQCETCRVSVISGSVDPKGTADGDTVLACQAHLVGDAEIAFEEVPTVTKRVGEVASLEALSSTIAQVKVKLNARLPYLPGQYVNVGFAGFPERAYSVTIPLDASADELQLAFHVRRFSNGVVSSELGRKIGLGRKVTVRGPFGHAYLRKGQGKLLFISGGTGFAPVWSMALASCLSNPSRPMSLIVGVADASDLYMRQALDWLRRRGVTDIVTTADTGSGAGVRKGRPTDYFPTLIGDETIYAAGTPAMVAAIKGRCRDAGVRCFADPFTEGKQTAPLFQRLSRLLQPTQPSAPSSRMEKTTA
jgi:NAD(P)H-flavin reductase/ferredoxin